MYKQKKTDYQRGYDDGKELVATHINADGKAKAKEYIKKLAEKNKGKTDALEYFVNNSASYFVPHQFISENNNNKEYNMKNRIRLTESQLHRLIKKHVKQALNEGHWDSSVYEKFEEVRNAVGDDTLISELYNWLDGDSIEEFIENMDRNYDLGLSEEDDDLDF